MYEVIYMNDSTGDYTLIARVADLESAKAARSVSGDIVVSGGNIVQSTDWLWEWEKDPEKQSYPLQLIQRGKLWAPLRYMSRA